MEDTWKKGIKNKHRKVKGNEISERSRKVEGDGNKMEGRKGRRGAGVPIPGVHDGKK